MRRKWRRGWSRGRGGVKWGRVHSSAAGPGLLRAMLLFCPLFPFISPFLFCALPLPLLLPLPFAALIFLAALPKGQQHKCRKFEWTSAVNEICKYFSKIELLWQIFCVRRTWAAGGCAGWRFMKISEENWFEVLWSAKTHSAESVKNALAYYFVLTNTLFYFFRIQLSLSAFLLVSQLLLW